MTDTGPPYPPAPPIALPAGPYKTMVAEDGTLIPFDWRRTIISQYANSPILTGMIERLAQSIDQKPNFDAFVADIWDLDTAQGIGLDIWGRIVGVERTLEIASGDYLGFEEALPGSEAFNDAGYPTTYGAGTPGGYAVFAGWGFAEAEARTFGEESFGIYGVITPGSPPVAVPGKEASVFGGPFYTGQNLLSEYRLDDTDYRRLIYGKAAANICDGSIPSINRILLMLFPGRGNCFVTDCPPLVPYLGFHEAVPGALTYSDAGGLAGGYTAYAGFGFKEAGGYPFGQASFGLYAYNVQGQTVVQSSSFGGPFFSGEITPRMTMTYTFEFPLSLVDYAIVARSGVLPKPVGVAATIVQI